jgi:regulator of replication initiation timing
LRFLKFTEDDSLNGSRVSQGLELNTARNELQYLKDENEKMKLESKQWSERMEQAARQHEEQLAQREQELHRIASEKSGLSGLATALLAAACRRPINPLECEHV